MAGRFNELFRMSEGICSDDPVSIEVGVLQEDLKTGNKLVQLKMKNNSGRTVSGVKVFIEPYTQGLKSGSETVFDYSKLNVPAGELFGSRVPVFLDAPNADSFKCKIEEVFFNDRTAENTAQAENKEDSTSAESAEPKIKNVSNAEVAVLSEEAVIPDVIEAPEEDVTPDVYTAFEEKLLPDDKFLETNVGDSADTVSQSEAGSDVSEIEVEEENDTTGENECATAEYSEPDSDKESMLGDEPEPAELGQDDVDVPAEEAIFSGNFDMAAPFETSASLTDVTPAAKKKKSKKRLIIIAAAVVVLAAAVVYFLCFFKTSLKLMTAVMFLLCSQTS